MRINSRNWPYWVLGAATVWFVAIAAFWAFRPLDDHVATTVAPTAAQLAAAQAAGQPLPGRQAGPTVAVECHAPAASASRNVAEEQAVLAALRDGNGVALGEGRFTRVPCVNAHRQAHLLWYIDVVLYALVVAAMVAVLVRRQRQHRHVPASAFAAA
jgi:hypothetical protein